MTNIYLLSPRRGQKRLLGIKTPLAELWNSTLQGPDGSCQVKGYAEVILRCLMLRSRMNILELVSVLWPDPADEPEWSEHIVPVTIYRMKRKLISVGLQCSASNRQSARVFGYELRGIDVPCTHV